MTRRHKAQESGPTRLRSRGWCAPARAGSGRVAGSHIARPTYLAQRPELRSSCLSHHRDYLCRNGAFVDSNDITLRLSVITVVAPRCCDRPGQFVYQSEHIGLLHTF